MVDHLDLSVIYNAKTKEELRAAYDQWADAYDAQIVDDYGYRGHELVVAAIRPHLADDARLLDAGAGSGTVGMAAIGAGFTSIDAVDMSTRMLEKAKARGIYGDIRVGVLGEPLDYDTDSYDGVLSSGVFTPGHAPASCLDELVRIVKPSGLISFTLRHDEPPPGYADAMDSLSEDGAWALVEVSDPFHSMPKGEPEVEHRIWLYRVLSDA